ncbi:redoxin domain-containing protein, partial [Candidatus Omnitrophota bacterium]
RRIRSILSEKRNRIVRYPRMTLTAVICVTILSFVIACILPLSSRLEALEKSTADQESDGPAAGKQAQRYNATAYAIPLDDIVIDGKLDDWPDDMILYPIRNYGWTYGPTDIDNEDLSLSADFNPNFHVGYSSDKNLLYLAFVVCDDSLFTFKDHSNNNLFDYPDVCEIYLEGKHESGKMFTGSFTAEALPGMQYVMAAPGDWYGMARSDEDRRNPRLIGGEMTQTRTQAVCSRNGDITVFEWAVEIFDNYPETITELVPGKTIGFDVAVVDRDSDGENSAWGCWAPLGFLKVVNVELMGDLVLLKDHKKIGKISGRITNKEDKSGVFRQYIDIYREGKPYTNIQTDSQGQYETSLLAGDYSLWPRYGRGYIEHREIPFTIIGGKETNVDVSLTPIKLPKSLEKSLEIYASLNGYSDVTEIEAEDKVTCSFQYSRSGKMRAIYNPDIPGPVILYNGTQFTTVSQTLNQYSERSAPEKLSVWNIAGLAGWLGSGFVHELLVSGDPLLSVRDGLLDVREVRSEEINGIQTTIVELKMLPGVLSKSVKIATEGLVVFRLYIGMKDNLIHAVETEFDERPEAAFEKDGGKSQVIKEVFKHLYTAVKLNPGFPSGTFDYKPSEEMEKVTRFVFQRVSSYPPKGTTKIEDITGKKAPDFLLKDLEGKEVSSSDFKGNVLLINFWTTWSGASRKEIPMLVDLQSRFKSKGFTVLGISDDRDPKSVQKYAEDYSINYPLVIADDKVKQDFDDVSSFPTTIIIDRNNIIRYNYWGPVAGEDFFRKQVEKLLDE